ncbi:glycosyltransferase family 4 protein [Virgibacillus natechei]
MKVAISAIRTKNISINRHELVTDLKNLGHDITYIGQESNDNIHPDYEKYNVPFLPIPLGRSNTNPFQELKSIKETKRVLKDNNINVLIAYGIRTFPTMVIAAKLAGVKKVLCIANGSGRLFNLRGLKGSIIKSFSYPMLCLSFLFSNKILFQNPDDLKMIKNKGLLLRKNFGIVNGSGVNLDKFKFASLEKKPVFTMISRLTGDKGVNEYIQAAKIVKSFYPEAEFHLIGPMDKTDLTLNINELYKSIDNGIITMRGKVRDVRPFLDQSRFFVLPSYQEGTPRTVLEAMSMGRPIITTDTTGCRETVDEGVNGFKVPVKNVKSLSDKMIWMIKNPKEVERMGKESRKICEEKFDVHKVNNKILNTIGLKNDTGKLCDKFKR